MPSSLCAGSGPARPVHSTRIETGPLVGGRQLAVTAEREHLGSARRQIRAVSTLLRTLTPSSRALDRVAEVCVFKESLKSVRNSNLLRRPRVGFPAPPGADNGVAAVRARQGVA